MLALQAMRAAYSGIQYCCDCLREGSVEIQRVKKTVEGGVADAKKIYTEVSGLWGWIKGLLGGAKPPQAAQTTAPQPAGATEPEKVSKGTRKSSKKDVIRIQQFWIKKYFIE
jgi:hypothetical protein